MSSSDDEDFPFALTPPPSVSTAILANPITPPAALSESDSQVLKPDEDEQPEEGVSDLAQLLIIAEAIKAVPSVMLNPQRMSALLSLNTDGRVSHFAMFTTHGTLLSHDNEISVPTTRSFAALMGLTWRHHAEAFAASDGTKAAPDIQHVKTLKLIRKSGKPKELKSMIVEWEGIVAGIEEVKPKILLAAEKPIDDFVNDDNEDDTLSKKILALSVSRNNNKKGAEDKTTSKDNDNDVGVQGMLQSAPAPPPPSQAIKAEGEGGGEDDGSVRGKGKNPTVQSSGGSVPSSEEFEGDAAKSKSTMKGKKPTKAEILLIRAEVLAKAVVEEWPGEVPDDFY